MDGMGHRGEEAPSAQGLFVDWLARREAGEEVELEELCAAHPELAPRLRELHANWLVLEEIRAELGRRQSGAGGRARAPSAGAEPASESAASRAGAASREEPTEEILERLAGRSAAFSRYRVEDEIDHGGMGTILRVWDEDMRRALAMKVVRSPDESAARGDAAAVDSRMLARFLEEAQVTGQLDHPGIVPVHAGVPVGFAGGWAREYLFDRDVEIAQGARIPDPILDYLDAGVRGTLRLEADD